MTPKFDDDEYLQHIEDAAAKIDRKLIHGYFSVDMPLVLDTVRVMLPDFRARIKALRRPR